ncbi:hypothetical protein [Sphingomonas profundi]|uniref:hypothetical protein n=1 Tax=Alterirhizorhabdus profundi TaxID=2681549 RepID=UPI0012E87569|nr:hypothetical protein [Sphingomonas profundi]
MSRLALPGILDVLRVDDATQIDALAADPRFDRRYVPRGPLINRMVLRRIRRVLAIDGVPLPPVAPRGAERPLPAQAATEAWLDGLAEAGIAGDDVEALAAWVRGAGDGPVGELAQQAVGRLFAADYRADRASWAAARVMGAAPSDFNPLRMLLWGLTRRVERARDLLAEKVGGDATGVHATGVAIHNIVSGLEAMRAQWSNREARERLSVSAAVAKAIVAPRQVVRQPTVAGSTAAGAFTPDTLVLLRLETANRADPGYDTAFMDGAWSECPARRWVPALLAAVWRRAQAQAGTGAR